MNLPALIEQMRRDEVFFQTANNPLSMFGTQRRPYLGATLFPSRPVPENSFVEEGIRFRTVIANDATRHSPVQFKEGVLVAMAQVILGNHDIGSKLTGQDYDTLIRVLQKTGNVAPGAMAKPTMDAVTRMTDWTDRTLNLPLQEKCELQRWQCLVGASVLRTGDNGYTETVSFPNPTGHRVTAGTAWSTNTYDPWDDIVAGANFLQGKGLTVRRIITSTTVKTILVNNAKVKARAGRISFQPAGIIAGIPGRVSLEELNSLLQQDGLPPIEIYDTQYYTQAGSGYFLPRNVLVMVCDTQRDETIDLGDQTPLVLNDTLGYYAVGRPSGQDRPGVPVIVRAFEDKPPRVEGQAWMTGFPVLAEPEAVYVINGIS